jgi:FMN phosphatase YigB (HAD superfamily)
MSTQGLTLPSMLVDESRLPHDGSTRLAAARRLIEQGLISVLSLDMFDTIVWRRVPRPTDAFVLLGTELVEAGLLDPQIRPAAFRKIRMEAEHRARLARSRRGEGVEVSIEEIWDEVPARVRRLQPAELAIDHELALERRISQPDLDIIALAEFATEQGCRLAIVSNTYLSAQQLARLLTRPETEVLRPAAIFPSSKYGVSKADGLWKIVLEELGVPADRVVHVGDELVSDIEAPGHLGIHTVHIPRFDYETARMLEREGALPPEHLGPVDSVVDHRDGDFGFTNLRAKVGSRAVNTLLPVDQATAWRFGASVVGPVLTGFAQWVHDRTAELGASTAWCMMREGELLADLIQRVGLSQGGQVRAEPIWLSRHVTRKATLTSGKPDELRTLLNRRLAPTVAEFLANLGLAVGEVPELRQAAGERMDRPALAAEVVETLGGSEHLRARIVAEADATRARLVNYLRPMLTTPDGITVVVDLGWGGTIQKQLVEALRLTGIERRIVGLYLATNELGAVKTVEGIELTGYLIDAGEPSQEIIEIGRSPEIIEQSCLASCGSLSDFAEDGTPILDPFTAPPEQVTSKVAVQQGIRAFQREWLRYAEGVVGWPALDGRERSQLLEILRRAVTHPTLDEARTFGAWTHDDNFGVDRRDRVIPERLGAYVPYLSPTDLLEMTMQDAFWPLGLAAAYDPGLAASTQAILSGRIPRDAFESTRTPGRVEMAVDSGNGWTSHQSGPLRINHNGLSYAKWDLRADHIVSARFDPCNHPAIFKVDWIEIGLRVRGHGELVHFLLQGASDLSALIYAGSRWLYDGVGISLTDDPQIHIPLAHRAQGEIYGVEMTVAFAVMALPPTNQAVGLGRADFGTSLSWAIGKAQAETAAGGPTALGRAAWRVARRRLRP